MKYALSQTKVNGGFPPKGGWKYRQTETKWENPSPMESNFQETLDIIISHRRANRAHNLSVDRLEVAQDLMHQTALRILSECPEHATDWVVPMDEEAKKNSRHPNLPSPPSTASTSLAGRAARLLSRVRGIAGGVATLTEWIGDGATPASEDTANARARTCSACPLNQPGIGVVEAIGEAIRKQTVVKNSLSLVTEVEDKLHNCTACECYLRLKVWLPLETLRTRTTPETLAKLHPSCWILRELNTVVPTPRSTRTLTVQRKAAFGDVILATLVADRLAEIGIQTKFATEKVISTGIGEHPNVKEWLEPNEQRPDVILDGAYENNLERNRKDIGLLMLEAASQELRKFAVPALNTANRVPTLRVTDDERGEMRDRLRNSPRPWIVVVDGSASWPNRQWDQAQLERLPSLVQGSCIWSKSRKWKHSPPGYHNAQIGSFRELMALIAVSDIVVTPDTGPIHVAAAFNKPVVALEQCNDTRLRLTNLTDWIAVAPALDCVRCGEFTCPIDAAKPPCQKIDAGVVAVAIHQKLDAYRNGKVSCVIAAIRVRPDTQRCVDAAVGQCDEVIIVGDGDMKSCPVMRGVKFVPSTGTRLGYGKTAMRAIRGTVGEFILLLNDDCYLDPKALDAMKAAMTSGVGAVGALLRYPDGTIQHGGQYRPKGTIGFGHIDHRAVRSRFTQVTEMESVTGACLLVRRKALFDVRGFDERYDCYSEDTDFCMKLRQAGWRIKFQPAATAIHVEHQSTGPTKEAMLRHGNETFSKIWRTYLLANEPLISNG